MPALLAIAERAAAWQVRQSAALELRKASQRFWPALGAEKQDVKRRLLARLLTEPENRVKHTLARVAEPIAKSELATGAWPELMQFIEGCVSSADASQRELGSQLLFNLVEALPDAFAPAHLATLFGIFSRALQDAESTAVRVAGLLGLGATVAHFGPEHREFVEPFRALVPHMLQLLDVVFRDAELVDKAVQLVEVFDAFLAVELPLLSRHFPAVISFFVGAAKGDGDAIAEDVRIMCLNFLMWAIVYRKTRLVKDKLVEPIVATLMDDIIRSEGDDLSNDGEL